VRYKSLDAYYAVAPEGFNAFIGGEQTAIFKQWQFISDDFVQDQNIEASSHVN